MLAPFAGHPLELGGSARSACPHMSAHAGARGEGDVAPSDGTVRWRRPAADVQQQTDNAGVWHALLTGGHVMAAISASSTSQHYNALQGQSGGPQRLYKAQG